MTSIAVAAGTTRSPMTRPEGRVYVKTILTLALALRLTVVAIVLFTIPERLVVQQSAGPWLIWPLP